MRIATSRSRMQTALVIQLTFIGVVVSLATIIGTTFLRSDHVTSRAQLSHLHYGIPLTWATQDQSQFTPPMPATMSFADPRNVPTSTSETPLLIDIAIVAVVPSLLYGGYLGGATLWRRRRASPTRHLTVVT